MVCRVLLLGSDYCTATTYLLLTIAPGSCTEFIAGDTPIKAGWQYILFHQTDFASALDLPVPTGWHTLTRQVNLTIIYLIFQ